MASKHMIRSVTWDEDGTVSIQYLTVPDDVRNRGFVLRNTALVIAPIKDYEDEMQALHEAAQELLKDALDDFNRTEPVDLTRPDDDEDDEDE